MKPSRVLRVDAKVFGDSYACCGNQLVRLLQVIESVHPDLIWYAANVNPIYDPPVPFRDYWPEVVGDTAALIALVSPLGQLLSGVFAGIAPSFEDPEIREGGWRTEDDEIGADLCDFTVELRAFDTSFWEVAVIDPQLAQTLIEHLGGRDIGVAGY